MKKGTGLSIAILLLLSSIQVKAQNDDPGPKIGVKAGLNFSQLYVDQPNAEDENIKMGYHLGLFGKIPVTGFLAVQPEVLYTHAGSKITYGGSDITDIPGIEPGEVRFNLNYVQVPVAWPSISVLCMYMPDLTVGARYDYGLREIGDSGLAGSFTEDSKNSVVQIYLGFGI